MRVEIQIGRWTWTSAEPGGLRNSRSACFYLWSVLHSYLEQWINLRPHELFRGLYRQ
jgi:hypothetical protein